MVSGGLGAETSVEALYANGTRMCFLQDFPDMRMGHTMDGLTTCGGYDKKSGDSCLSLTNGQWVKSHQLTHRRYGHVSWSTDDELILLGGERDCQTNSEILTRTSLYTETNNVITLEYRTRYV